MRILLICVLFCTQVASPAWSIDPMSYVTTQAGKGRFPLVTKEGATPIVTSEGDYAGVVRAVKNLQADMKQVLGKEPIISVNAKPAMPTVILVGTLGKCPLIDQLVREKKLDVSVIKGKWETFITQVIHTPLPGVEQALVIVGSDKRGTIYGVYDLSAQIGVSPWNWWADVPVEPQSALFILPGQHTQGTPAVKYRGIFINDEAPALSSWAKEKFGGFNHQFYEKVFELILRLKGNYLWPAMWGSAFYDDDKLNPIVADEVGVVIGTTHHEPLMRAHDEWRRYGKGPWNYQQNDSTLRVFWRKGIQRMGTNESIVSVGMRGDGDAPMSRESNTALLERIVADQRTIIADVTSKPASETPQLWALYKEVQAYYDKGMRVPDDVTLLLCDDNWGNIRKLPAVGTPQRQGGYGIYYHFDYVGGPRNYKWLNTSPIARTWEQMHLAYEHGVDRIWIVNVGDIKPMEFPIEFFLDYAWDPHRWPAEKLTAYARLWAAKQFGTKHANTIATILTNYTQYNSRRKPELLGPETYSLLNYREAETIVAEYNKLLSEAVQVDHDLPAKYRDAFFQLVLHPVKACANLNELYVTVAQNRLYAKQGRAATNALAKRAEALFERDAQIGRYYNDTLVNGKWHHLMDQTHIGYTYWQQPEKNTMPKVETITVPTAAQLGVAVEGSEAWWPASEKEKPTLPVFNAFQPSAHYIDVFNRGQTPFTYTVMVDKPWVHASSTAGTIYTEQRLWVSIDWAKAPAGTTRVPITITSKDGVKVVVEAVSERPIVPKRSEVAGFVASNGYVSMEAAHYTKAIGQGALRWETVPRIGRTDSGVMITPVTAPSQEKPGGTTAHLEYRVFLPATDTVQVKTYVSPTLNFSDNKGLRYAISFDDEQPQRIDIHADETNRVWEQSVANNIRILTTRHTLTRPGEHTLKVWFVDPAVVIQKLVIDEGGLKPSYLGPPESFHRTVHPTN